MRAHHGRDIERCEAFEQAAPDHRDEAGRNKQLRKLRKRAMSHLVASDGRAISALSAAITRLSTSR